jgi:hypothetical protein
MTERSASAVANAGSPISHRETRVRPLTEGGWNEKTQALGLISTAASYASSARVE